MWHLPPPPRRVHPPGRGQGLPPQSTLSRSDCPVNPNRGVLFVSLRWSDGWGCSAGRLSARNWRLLRWDSGLLGPPRRAGKRRGRENAPTRRETEGTGRAAARPRRETRPTVRKNEGTRCCARPTARKSGTIRQGDAGIRSRSERHGWPDWRKLCRPSENSPNRRPCLGDDRTIP